MNLSNEQQELVDFAYRQSKGNGGRLEVLLKHGVVGFQFRDQYQRLLTHLQTNKNFGLITGFDHNEYKMLIWLDTLPLSLKRQFKWNH